MAVNSFSLFLPSFIDWLLHSGWSLWLFGRREITGQLMKKSLALLDLTLIFLSKYTKTEMNFCGMVFVQLVYFCAHECQTAGTNICGTIAEKLLEISAHVMKPIDLIVKLYAKALLIKTCYDRISTNDTKNERGRRLLEEGESLLKSIDLLKSLRSYFWSYCKNKCALPKACTEEYKEDYMISCFKALKFFYLLLAEAVKSEKIDKDTVPQDVFYTYCDAFKSLHSCTFKEDGGGVMVFDVALAAFSLSIASSSTMKQSAHVIKDIIREWNNPQGILYLSDVLYNIGLHLRRKNQVQQAFKAMKLCCRASRKHVLLLFKLVDTKTGVDLKRYVEKMCYNSAQLLHFLNYLGCQNAKLQREIVRSLETWSDAGRQFSMLSVPVMLVKVWVKITVVKNRGVKDGNAQTISNLLISSKQATKRTREIILEQDLGAYEEFYDIGPEFCDIMILEIFKILKEDLTTTEDGCILLIGKKSIQNKCLQVPRILLRIGLAFRAKGMDHYIRYLSEAIIKMDGATCSGGTPLCHQLAVAYCLRAICSLEAKPNSKQVTQDINAAVKRWTSILITAPSELDDIFTEIIRLLYYIVNLLSLKVYSAVAFSVHVHKLKIDQRLGLFLSDLEDVWFGPWKYMLLREWSSNKTIN